jgi:hypothetical protein
MPITFGKIKIGKKYTRPELATHWNLKGYEALARGIVTPRKTNFIILFITAEKQSFLTQYRDIYDGKILEIEGELGHGTDHRIFDALIKDDEIHLFFRIRHHMPFTYEGKIKLIDYKELHDSPSRFRFLNLDQ